MASAVDQLPAHPPGAKASAVPWVPVAWFTVLLIAAYSPILRALVNQWATDEDVSHGFFVPAVAVFIAWQRRGEILALDLKPNWWGLAVMGWAAAQGFLGMLAAELFLQRSSFVIALVGLLLLVGGAQLIRALAFPLLLLPFMIPIPAVIYNQITLPLQFFASQMAEMVLGWVGIPVLRDGNILELASQKLSVVEACSGIRSLLSLTFLSQVYAYFFDKRIWMRWFLLMVTIPIAILANAGRVAITGILSEFSVELAQGFFHELEGWVIFLIAVGLLAGVHMLVSQVIALRGQPHLSKGQSN
jgi:exosortase